MSIISRKFQRGFSLVSAIFILVVLAVLAGMIVTVSSSQHVSQALDIQGARAYQAARVGQEWGVYQVLQVDTEDTNPLSFPHLCRGATYAAPVAISLAGMAGDLAPYTVTVTCGALRAAGELPYSDGDVPNIRVYQITATACNQPAAGSCPNLTAATVGGVNYVERQIQATVSN